MDKIQINIRGEAHNFEGPGNYEEVDERLIMKLMQLAIMAQSKPYAYFLIVRLLYNLPDKISFWLFDKDYIKRCEPAILDDDLEHCLEQGLALIKQTSWVFETLPKKWIISSVSNKVLRPLFGPDDGLDSSSFKEFMFAEKYFEKFEQTKDIVWLQKMAAVLYRPGNKKRDGDRRNGFDIGSVDSRAKEFKNSMFLQYVHFNYKGVRALLANTFRYVFEASEKKAENTEAGGSWLDVACALAGEHVNYIPEIENMNLWVILKYLDGKIKTQKEATA